MEFRYTIRRVHCTKCDGVKTEEVPWAVPGSNFTLAFEERVAWLAQQCSQTAVSKLMRVVWRTVGSIVSRVVPRHLDTQEDRLNGLRHLGIDELSYRRHHEYITVVVDHERSVVVWAARGKNADTLRAFFDELGPERCAKIESVTIDMSQAYITAVTEKVPAPDSSSIAFTSSVYYRTPSTKPGATPFARRRARMRSVRSRAHAGRSSPDHGTCRSRTSKRSRNWRKSTSRSSADTS